MNKETKSQAVEKTPWLRAFLMTPPVFFAHFVAFFTLLFVLVSIVSRYMEIYDQLDLPLPYISVLLVQSSVLAARFWYIPALLLILFDPLLIFWLYTWRGRWSWLRDAWNIGFLLLVIFSVLLALMIADAPLRYQQEQAPEMPPPHDRRSTVFIPPLPGTPPQTASA